MSWAWKMNSGERLRICSGAANRTRTCDPVITNDVLYQLSYCGGPNAAVRRLPENACHLISGSAHLGKKNASFGLPPAPARQNPPPATGLRLGRGDLLGEFVPGALVVDSGVVGRPDDGNYRWNGRWNR